MKPTPFALYGPRPIHRLLAAGLMACAAAFAGCGGDAGPNPPPEGLVPVSGVVTLDDKPLSGATVMFIPKTTGAPDAQAVTNESGAYQLRSAQGQADGAAPGDYRVVITKFVMPDGSVAAPTAEKSPMQLSLEGAKEEVHADYSDLAFSKLTATVPAGGGEQNFKLSSKGGITK